MPINQVPYLCGAAKIHHMPAASSSENKFGIFIKNTPTPVAMLDTEMNYLLASDKWYTTYNIKAGSLKGKNHYDIFPEIESKPEWKEAHRKALNGEVINNDEDLFIRKDGTRMWLRWSVVPWFTDSEEIGGIIMSTEDITDIVSKRDELSNQKKELERQVSERTKELKKVNEELEAFSYSVSHDLRSPLRAITGFGQILKQDYGSSLDSEGNRLLDIVIQNAHNMGELIDDILTFSRLGRSSLSLSKLNFESLCETVYQGLIVTEKNLKDRIELTFKHLPVINADAKMIRQAVENLLSNAIKYSSMNDGPIHIEIGCKEVDEFYQFYIKDNGIGFDPEYSHKLFEIFQRLHSQEEFEGTGVGLALVKRIINRHNGTIWAESSPGHGSTFYFTLPKKEPNNG